MAAYLIVNIEITDHAKYAEYVKVVPATLTKFGARYLARGGRAEALEGIVPAKRVVILEFDSYERAKEWWESDEYAGPKALRQASSITSMILVEGL